jgi:hypothetical protein
LTQHRQTRRAVARRVIRRGISKEPQYELSGRHFGFMQQAPMRGFLRG